ncbi:MAG TPA: O-methyltransferase [Thermoanaerobaculia bacterium]|nr:O-methyltransferase [Thermoanaerobaculia bacterium]
MKDRPDAILRREQAAYLERLLPPRDPLLAEIEREAAAEGIPISDPEVGRLLAVLARAIRAQRILEVGTAIGYGTLCLARAAPEAQVVSIDHDPARLARAGEVLRRAGVAERAQLVEGEALEVLPRLEGPFDLVYLDAVKRDYRRYLDLALPKMRVGGLLVADNLLWKGRVAEPPEDEEDADAEALGAFNGYLMMHPQLQALVLPLGDGVGLAVKTRPTMMEMGGPF